MSQKISAPDCEVPGCCANGAETCVSQTKFHFALNVSDLRRSVDFYRRFFGQPPAKQHDDYAKFELDSPPLVFSLVPNPPASAGALSHFGLPVRSSAEVEAAAVRLHNMGLKISCQQGTVCGYARQDKVWVADPDHNYWEIYVVHEDVDPETVRSGYDGIAPQVIAARRAGLPAESVVQQKIIWEHRVMQPAPERIPYADGVVDEIRLEGTFNSALTAAERERLLAEARRALKAGGSVLAHGLVADRPLPALPALPGVAALVKQVPVEAEPLRELRAAGFENLRITKLAEAPVFRSETGGMREIKITCMNPASATPAGKPREIVYKGPFAEAVDEQGQVFARGRRTEVSAAAWERLSRSAAAKQFLFLGNESLDESACGASR